MQYSAEPQGGCCLPSLRQMRHRIESCCYCAVCFSRFRPPKKRVSRFRGPTTTHSYDTHVPAYRRYASQPCIRESDDRGPIHVCATQGPGMGPSPPQLTQNRSVEIMPCGYIYAAARVKTLSLCYIHHAKRPSLCLSSPADAVDSRLTTALVMHNAPQLHATDGCDLKTAESRPSTSRAVVSVFICDFHWRQVSP